MFLNDKKKIASIIVSRISPDGKDAPPIAQGQNDIKEIALDMIHAIRNQSPEDLEAALRAFWDCIKLEDEMEDQEEDSEEAE